MLRVERIPKNAGKFIIERAAHTDSLVRFVPKDKYYDSIEEAIEAFQQSLNEKSKNESET
jgi:hypothetical protein